MTLYINNVSFRASSKWVAFNFKIKYNQDEEVVKIFKLEEKEGIQYYIVEEFLRKGLVKHAFSTRSGGVSKKPYDTLNLGLHVDDKKEDVLENRKRICRILDSDYKELVAGEQTHNDRIKIVTSQDKGKGAIDYDSALKNTDALITNEKGILLSSYYADCTPVFFLDSVKMAIGLAHAGWKGTVKKIAQQTVLKMQDTYNSNPEDILVAIGPSIGACCYQVDQRVVDALAKSFAYWEELVIKEGDDRWRLDLSLTNQRQLEEIGVKRENIIQSDLCTSCNSELLFSYRHDNGKTGRMGSFIKLTINN